MFRRCLTRRKLICKKIQHPHHRLRSASSKHIFAGYGTHCSATVTSRTMKTRNTSAVLKRENSTKCDSASTHLSLAGNTLLFAPRAPLILIRGRVLRVLYVQARKTNAIWLRMQTRPLPTSFSNREDLASPHDKSFLRGMNANCSGVATLRKRTTPSLWRHGTSCVLADGGVGPSRARGNAVRQRRFPHQRPLDSRLPASFAP